MGLRRGISLALMAGSLLVMGMTVAESAAQAHGSKHHSKRWRPPVTQPMVSVSLESARGLPLTTVEHRGQTFVAGEHGERYEIRVTNNTGQRIEVVVSVDGLDAVSGRAGDFTRQRGYVVEPFGSVVIDGFRTSLERVAAFRFSDVEDSFAAQVGAPRNAGIIGVAVFKEQPRAIVRHHSHGKKKRPTRSASPGESRSPSTSTKDRSARRKSGGDRMHAPSRELGTRFGESRHSAVQEVSFTRANSRRPDFRTTIQYDSARGLAARGVPIDTGPVWRDPPPVDAWPGAQVDDRRFSQPPPGWTGRR